MSKFSVRDPGWPCPSTQSFKLTCAIRLVRAYGDRVPSVESLRRDFGVSRATAYRWRAAFLEAQERAA